MKSLCSLNSNESLYSQGRSTPGKSSNTHSGAEPEEARLLRASSNVLTSQPTSAVVSPPHWSGPAPPVSTRSQSARRVCLYADCKHGNAARGRRQCCQLLLFVLPVLNIKQSTGLCFIAVSLLFYGVAAASIMGLHRVYDRDVFDWTVSCFMLLWWSGDGGGVAVHASVRNTAKWSSEGSSVLHAALSES